MALLIHLQKCLWEHNFNFFKGRDLLLLSETDIKAHQERWEKKIVEGYVLKTKWNGTTCSNGNFFFPSGFRKKKGKRRRPGLQCLYL